MYEKIKVYLLASAVLLGVATVSCQKEQDVTIEKVAPTIGGQNSEQDALIAAMAQNEAVRAYVLANAQMLNAYEQWYTGLSEAERKSLEDAFEAGGPLPDYMSAEQRSQFNVAQQARADQIKAAFSQLGALSDEDKSSVWAKVREIIFEETGAAISPGGYMACHAAYNDCSWYCVDHGGGSVCLAACLTGFRTCTRR